MRKPFSKEQHAQDDAPAKKAVSRFLFKRWKYIPLENKDQYGVDILCMKDGKVVGYVEVERRHSWRGVFTYETVHVPARKKKYFDVPNTIIFSVRSDLRKAYWTTGQKVLESPIIIFDNKECENEDFFDVPLEKWTLVDL